MVQEHSDVTVVSVADAVLPSSLRPPYRLQRRKLNAPLIISTCTRLMSRHLKLYWDGTLEGFNGAVEGE